MVSTGPRRQSAARRRHPRAAASSTRTLRHLEAIQALTDTALAHLDLEHLLQALLDRVREVMAVDNVAILLLDDTGQMLTVRAVLGPEAEVAQNVHVPFGKGFAGTVAARRAPWMVNDLATIEVANLFLKERLHSILGVPLLLDDRVLGVIHIGTTQPRTFTDVDAHLLELVAERVARAIDRAQLYMELRELTATLEHRVAERTAQLQEANQALESFSYSVAHDLRAPLRAMQGFAQALREDFAADLDATAQHYIGRIVAGAERMDALIQDLLSYSRLSRDDIHLQSVSLRTVVAEALAGLEPDIREHGGAVVAAAVAVEGDLPRVRAHYGTLLQVVANLLGNAVKFVAPGVAPRVRVWAEPRREGRRGWVRLWVEDSGLGIAPEHQERIFRVFERLHGIESYPGTGIGLAIVRKGVERMGGRAGIESRLGEGSRFWIELQQVER